MIFALAGLALAQTVRIQGKEVPCVTVDGRLMVEAKELGRVFPEFENQEGLIDLERLSTIQTARLVRRDGRIVSVRYYDSRMQAIYERSREASRAAPEATDPPESTASSGSFRSIIEEIVRLSNRERGKVGAPPLAADSLLQKAAFGHSEEMAKLDYFSHESPTPGRESPHQRINLAGASPRASAENIAMFKGHPEETLAAKAVTAWMNSPGHRKNLLDPLYTHIGIGVGKRGDAYYLTQNFGAY